MKTKKNTPTPKLTKTRRQIDKLDSLLTPLLIKRFLLAIEVAKAKRTTGQPIFCKTREDEVIANALKIASKSKVPPAAIAQIYRDIIKISKKIQLGVYPKQKPVSSTSG